MGQYWIVCDTHSRFHSFHVPWVNKAEAEDAAREMIRDFPCESYHVIEADSSAAAMQALIESIQNKEYAEWHNRKRISSKRINHHLHHHYHPKGRDRP